MSVPPLVEFRSVEKRFGAGPPVLQDISLAAYPGDFVSLIGPSGCGKSTLLRLLAGLTPVSGGTLTVAARSPAHAAAELGFIFQEATLLPWLTVEKNIALPQKLRGTAAAKRDATTQEVLKLVGLTDKADAFPRQLSGGQKMRVSIARALSLSPKLLLLDEPFGALDEMTRERLNEELLTIRAHQAWTTFFVTHSVTEAVFLSSRVFVMARNPGRIHTEITIDLPYPRTDETRRAPAYQRIVAEVSRVLRSVETAAS